MEKFHHPSLLMLHVVLVLLLPIVTAAQSTASSPASDDTNRSGGNNSNNNNNNQFGYGQNFNPSMAIVIVVLISAFFFLGFFSIYLRQCGEDAGSRSGVRPAGAGGVSRGLDPDILATIPTLVYSEVKELKIGKTALECAVCITEFDDDDHLRLLPRCSHVFHPECIDAWLANHVTCPVCRSNLADLTADEAAGAAAEAAAPAVAVPPEQVVVEVSGEKEEREAEMAELARIASRRRGSGRPPPQPQRFPRSHSTGHSVESHDRFTLRLPEHVHREIVAAGRVRRAESLRGFPVAGGEGSSRRGYRGGAGEGSSRAGRTIRLGRSGRWPSFFVRNLSMKVPAWASVRRGDGEGSMKKGEWSMKKKTDVAGDEAAAGKV